ncbi:MAG: glycoside hydrolase family 15 protein, partial [Nitrospirota bacterium]|nr:glycoside hydrolase family 15 protein [Nitrospirota bacterium]
MPYQPIENYGLIGNMRTTALVGMNGSIDWLCFPHFDSPSVFAAILDDGKGGRFSIAPIPNHVKSKQYYWPDTNVLVTRFHTTDGVGRVIDFMPVGKDAANCTQRGILRRIQTIRGTMTFRMECRPSFNYGRDTHTITMNSQGGIFESPNLTLRLGATIPLQQQGDALIAEFTLEEGEGMDVCLQGMESDDLSSGFCPETHAEELFTQTVGYWRTWLSKCTYSGRWREMVQRSALVLKLLTFQPTGAIVAAPTCSLPEGIGGERNWDYRYTWIRDAAFTLYGLLRIGFTEEASQFMHWLEARCHELKPDGSLQIMYGIDGRHTLTEETLDHLEGYRGSSPVRIGNGAYDQLQLDIYGEMLDSVYLYNKYGTPISYDLWKHLRRLINWVCDNWQRTDEGVWEVRGGQQHFVYSKLMCWVAVDRGIRLADKRSFPADRDRWLKARDTIYEEIMEKGWDAQRQAFIQRYGSDSLDAANLMMSLVFFVSPTDPRMLRTLDATLQTPEKGGLVSNGLVYRYNITESTDGLNGEEGTFNICTFWLVEALTRAGQADRSRLEDARLLFEQMLGYANHLGLYAEETGH